MNKNQQFLSTMLRTIQTGKVEIRSVLDISMPSSLRNTLETQLQEYDRMETEAYSIALQRGWEVSDLEPGKRFLTDKLTRLKLNGRRTDSKIAGFLIKKNTNAMILGLKKFNQLEDPDYQLKILSQKLLDSATANIRQMQLFL